MTSIAAGVFLLLHLLAMPGRGVVWGVDSLTDFSPVSAAIAVSLVIPLMIPAVSRRLSRLLPSAAWSSRTGTAALVIALSVVFSVLSIRFPSAVPLLGDGQLVIDDLERATQLDLGPEPFVRANANAPLSARLVFAARAAGPESTFRMVGLLGGITWVVLAVAVSLRFARHDPGRWLILGFLLSGGIVQLFFGYVELYALLPSAILLFLLVLRREMSAGRPPVLSGVVLAAGVSLHFALITLAPAMAVAAIAGGVGRRRSLVHLAVGAGVTAVVAAVVLWSLGFDVLAYVRTSRDANFLPLFAEPTFRQAYRLFSVPHLVDLANELLLVAPAAVIALPFLRGVPWRDADLRMLATATAGPLLFIFLANPEIGAFRDWDMLSFAAVPLTLLVAVAVGRGSAAARVPSLAWPVIGVALLHTGLWIGVNADAMRAESRFVRALGTSVLSERARAYGWESQGGRYRDTGRTVAAADAYARAVASAPDSPRLWELVGRSNLAAGRMEPAEEAFARALELDPRQAGALAGRGEILVRRGQWQAAVPWLEEAVGVEPKLGSAWYFLGVSLLRLEETEKAMRALRAAAYVAPELAPVWFELGRAELGMRNVDAAREALERYLALAPATPQAEAARETLRALRAGEVR